MIAYGLTLLVLVASGAAPSPLYPQYEAEWSIAPVLLTIIFASYVVGLLVSLLTAGALSDYIGRKPVILAGLVVALVALGCFALANSSTELLVARVVQGFAIGLSMGALGAGMIDHQPARRPIAALLNGVVPPFGLTLGALGSGLLVQFAVAPHVLVYAVLAVATVACGIAIAIVPESVRRQPGALASLRPALTVPVESRAVFAGVVGCMLASWAIMGLYLSLGGALLQSGFGIASPVATGAMIASLTATGGVTGIAIARLDARKSMVTGAFALIVGPIGTVAGLWTHSLPLFIGSTIVAGIGFGAGFQGGLRLVLATAPASTRAGLLSSVYLVSYLAFGLPSVAAGALVGIGGLPRVAAYYAAFVAICAIVALVLQRVMRGSRRAELRADAIDREIEHASA
jgi:predicted MFS family arabinose efflux permease